MCLPAYGEGLPCFVAWSNPTTTMPIKLIPAYIAKHINQENIKSKFNNNNILDVLDDVTFAKLLGHLLTKIKSMFPSHSSAFESLTKDQLQIKAADEGSYVRICNVFTIVSLKLHKVLRKELQALGSCYIVSTYLY